VWISHHCSACMSKPTTISPIASKTNKQTNNTTRINDHTDFHVETRELANKSWNRNPELRSNRTPPTHCPTSAADITYTLGGRYVVPVISYSTHYRIKLPCEFAVSAGFSLLGGETAICAKNKMKKKREGGKKRKEKQRSRFPVTRNGLFPSLTRKNSNKYLFVLRPIHCFIFFLQLQYGTSVPILSEPDAYIHSPSQFVVSSTSQLNCSEPGQFMGIVQAHRSICYDKFCIIRFHTLGYYNRVGTVRKHRGLVR